ncbi:MAG: hypothetical protein J6B55_00055 [Clostridia bacterium]|nr:hypothetical protein [Clostridia bacterium]
MKDIHLLGKKILFDKSEVLLSYKPDQNWLDYFDIKSGQWRYEDGCLIGAETGNMGGILFTKERYEDNVMLSFTVSTVLPATRDLNAVFCADWDEATDYLGDSYVCGLNGWYENKAGLERNNTKLYATTSLYRYNPGDELRMTCGAIDGHLFMVVDDVLVSELIDPTEPKIGGHVGFSAYCTMLRIKDIEVRRICWEDFPQKYDPEF